VVRRTAPVQEAQRRIGSAESKHGSSTSSWVVEGVQHMCGSRNVQKVGAEMQITFAAPKMLRCFVTRALRSPTLCESSVALHFWCPQINPTVGMLRCEQ